MPGPTGMRSALRRLAGAGLPIAGSLFVLIKHAFFFHRPPQNFAGSGWGGNKGLELEGNRLKMSRWDFRSCSRGKKNKKGKEKEEKMKEKGKKKKKTAREKRRRGREKPYMVSVSGASGLPRNPWDLPGPGPGSRCRPRTLRALCAVLPRPAAPERSPPAWGVVGKERWEGREGGTAGPGNDL